MSDQSFLERFLTDESGQDIVEYALLTSLIGIASIVTWQLLANSVGAAYGQADADIQMIAPPPDPLPQ
ncbi:MAG TPA: hypothetical protein VJ813_06520 [Vicinamibacterales bacterium]|nr:hypothetical protein [Vicinamibacterales bacterium]